MQKKIKIDEITLVLAVAFIAMAVSVYEKSSESKVADAEKITEMLSDEHLLSFVSNGVINEDKFSEVKNVGYGEFKKLLNIKNDFCIYIEDGNGNVLLAKGSSK